MGILGWIVLGLLAGLIAKAIMPGNDPGGVIVTMLIGIVGAILGGFIGNALLGGGLATFFNLRTWLLAILGSLILLGVYRLVTSGRGRARV
ncbi:Transglycosylase associated protein [Alloactinosynnema sp. L-07]|uniref:GlsB/YeaQ/YmgE family stress response membrane protein n=1 Tax=Alloactinosynnema sp. L-07 TaxID=1653480 RepID=UPI00065F0A27|nr:GlsB/YeaQ/YmgE family stress response membrane protein [Alloactinosynnema sp. L-07]CRK58596.1 Transglycosylase associated protein [Alloactinosynnema sp. L-07]